MNSKIVTRFAPSPTGFLHVGGARTALFNYLFARRNGGKFLIRVEDTDLKRSSKEAVQAIFDGLNWLDLNWDEEPVSQNSQRQRHIDIAHRLLRNGSAYNCYCSQDELVTMREKAKAEGKKKLYNGLWRDRNTEEAPSGVDPVIRLKSPLTGTTLINDLIQGDVRVSNDELDDMVLIRADGTPTYMLAVVVDDHDMAISHVIRGDDHLTNTFRQIQIYNALGWEPPIFAHIPLLHGPNGEKLSKRHGALSINAYKDLGILPEAMNNYLLRLGWSHRDDEIISREQALEWFDLKDVGKSPARFDLDKLTSLSGHYIRHSDDQRLATLIKPLLTNSLRDNYSRNAESRLVKGMSELKERAKTIVELSEIAQFYAHSRPIPIDAKATRVLDQSDINMLNQVRGLLDTIDDWSNNSLEATISEFVHGANLRLGDVARPLRATLTGKTISPGIFEVLAVLGKKQALGRLDDVLNKDRSRC